MISKNQAKIVKSLGQKKFRLEHGVFVAEGDKVLAELHAANWKVKMLFTTRAEDLRRYPSAQLISEREMAGISQLSTPPGILAVGELPEWYRNPTDHLPAKAMCVIALDGIRDPGNLGTILRTAAWFGASAVVASPDSVDCFNPKVVQSSMGTIFRLPVLYVNLGDCFDRLGLPVYGLDLQGENLFTGGFGEGVYVVGSESHGLRKKARDLCSTFVTIPGEQGAESLNAAVSASIVLAELYRRGIGSTHA